MLNWQIINIPLVKGLETKGDVRASNPPDLDIARDLQFDEPGGLGTRRPLLSPGNQIFGGGTIANARRLVENGSEQLLFTNDTLYSWNAQLSKWISRGTHLAVASNETPRFVTTGDQVDGDRAELNGTIVYAWTEGVGAARSVYAAALDKTTGSVLVAPTAISPAGTFAGRPSLVSLATKILLFTDDGLGALKVRAIDPADPATGFASASTTVLITVFFGKYDVVRVDGADQAVGACNRNPATSYTAFTVTASLAVATSTKARTADGPIAVASTVGGAQTQIVRGNGVNVQGDLITTSTLADVFINQAIGGSGTVTNQIAVAFSGTTATVFWSTDETVGPFFAGFATAVNTVTTSNVVGSSATLALRLGVASRAFVRGGAVYIWLVFAEQSANFGTGVGLGVRAQLQNTYYLYRADGLIAGRAVFQVAGGYSPSIGRLPGVATTSGTGDDFAWLGAFRRRIELGGTDHTGYAARSPTDIAFSFDSNDARRTARLGRTLYITGSLLLQYDGFALTEVGFPMYPWAFATQDSGTPGNILAGTYSWKSTWKWTNGQGETERSTTATGEQLTLAASHFVFITLFFLLVTRKRAPRSVTVEIWRTLANTAQDSPYYLVTGQDPGVITGDNAYIPNDTTTPSLLFTDNLADGGLRTKETNPENGNVLESLAPPSATIIVPTETRLFLTGIAGDPNRVWYSRERNDGEIASFHDTLTIDVPPPGGRITALWFQDDTLYVSRETAIYAIPGSGLDNAGGGQGFGAARTVSVDVGAVSQEARAATPIGTIFKSHKGYQLLDRGGSLRYIGGMVNLFDADTVYAMHVMTAQHQVRIMTSGRVLIWDYRGAVDANAPDGLGQWAEWTITDGVHAAMWSGTYAYLTATGPKIEQASYVGTAHGIDFELSWIKMADLQGAARCRAFSFLGEWRSDFIARIRVARDYQYDGAGTPAYYDDVCWTPDTALVGNALQVKHPPTQGSCEAIKVRFTAVTDAVRATIVTTALVPQVTTSGAAWNATLRAVNAFPGGMGNRITMTVAFLAESSTVIDELPVDLPFTFSGPAAIEVLDHFTWSVTLERWIERVNNIGILIFGSPTVAEIESVITAKSKLATISSADATPTKSIAMVADSTTAGAFTGGVFGTPSGEACKLTGLALEIGVRPGINRRLAESQKTA